MILLTTSRRPTQGIRTFCRDLSQTIPNVLRMNRGKLSLDGLAEKATELNAAKVAVIDCWKSGPGKIELYTLSENCLKPFPPLIYLKSVKLRREFPQTRQHERKIKSLAIEGTAQSQTAEVKKLEKALSEFFEIPLLLREETYTKYNALMRLKTESPEGLIITFETIPEMIEIGPRIKVSHLIWDLTHES
ncbi:hypothetical protein KEJ45_05635 [Candidatus Bathyarchaeota archaeon]|nr:hypothetical protein [Candidatus Bathyarchaeota archaeon]